MKVLALLVSLLPFVNPFVGTGGHGHTFPGAAYPFGMVQLSPDTRPWMGDWDGCSGYHYSDSLIYGFSHTHLSGTGVGDLCDILFMPTVDYSAETIEKEYYRSHFSHSSEKASPGYYEVTLDDTDIQARLTVGRRMGYHQYTYPGKGNAQLIIDLRHRDHLSDFSISVKGNVVSGHRVSDSWAKGQTIYFYAVLSERPKSIRDEGKALLIDFGKKKVVTAKVGISSVSTANAMINLLYEDGIEGFEDCKRLTEDAWKDYLSVLDCPGTADKNIFYTALYHCAIHPSLWSDANGQYRGMDGLVHDADGWERYTIFSLWDTFRGLHPLLCKIAPDLTVDFLNSFISIFNEAGKLPVWELDGYETNCMIGFHSAPVFAESLQSGIENFNVEGSLYTLIESFNANEPGLNSFRRNGLVLAEDDNESVSKTLEYAYDCWCVSRVAEWLLAHPDRHSAYTDFDLMHISDQFSTASQYWRNVCDPETGFMRARQNGRWFSPFDPREVNGNYTEANAWQYSFFVPHDIVGLIRAHGGPKGFERFLDELFSAPEQTTGRTQGDITGLIGQYAHGNEPSHHIPYLYGLVGRKDKQEQLVSRIMDTLYSNAPDGLCGNEDCGQMSAWYILSALGEYSVCPGTTAGSLTYQPKTIVVNPSFEMDSDTFENSLRVRVGTIDSGCTAWYRFVPTGTEAEVPFIPYSGEFVISDSGTLEAYSVNSRGTASFTTRSKVQRCEEQQGR